MLCSVYHEWNEERAGTGTMSWQAGDVVTLKSGGPLMTVESVGGLATRGEETVFCVWSEPVSSRQVIQRGTFSPAVLERGRRPPPLALRGARA